MIKFHPGFRGGLPLDPGREFAAFHCEVLRFGDHLQITQRRDVIRLVRACREPYLGASNTSSQV